MKHAIFSAKIDHENNIIEQSQTMDLLFYHLQSAPLERVLPDLLQKSLDKGWQAIVETAPQERVDALDTMLWTFADESFLPHGKSSDPGAEQQPIVLTHEPDNPNKADIRFFVDSGDVTAHTSYQRLVYIFNGHDEEAVERARTQWKAAKAQNITATYWQQNQAGAWEKKA